MEMYNIVRMVVEKMLDKFSTGEKITWGYTSFFAWWQSLHFFALSWGPILSVLLSVVTGITVAVGNVIAIDYYKEHWKPKLFKNSKNVKGNDNEKAA